MVENNNPNLPFRGGGGFRPMIEGSGDSNLGPYAGQLSANPDGGGPNNPQFKSFKCNVCFRKCQSLTLTLAIVQ